MTRLAAFRRHLPPLLLLAGLLVLQALDLGPIEAVRLRIFDAYQRTIPAEPIEDKTLIVDIDDRSLTTVGQWPWDRATVAELISRVNAERPAAIALDIVFPEPDRLSPPRLIERLSLEENTLPGDLADTDRRLAEVLADAPVVAAIAAAPVRGPNPLPEPSIATLGGAPHDWLPRFEGAVANLPLIGAEARGAGNITIEPGLDGVVRQMPLLTLVGDQLLPALSLEAVRVASGERTHLVETRSWGVATIHTGDAAVPTDGNGRIWLHYGRPDRSRYVSAIDVLEGTVPQGRFAGRIVLVGSSAFGLWDIRATPLAGAMPGVEIQAQTIDGLRSGDLLNRPNYTLGLEVLFTALACAALILTFHRIGASWTLVCHLIAIGTIVGFSWWAYASQNWLIDASYPVMAGTILYLAMVYAGHVRSESRREGLTAAFKKYLSPVLVERLSHDGAKVDLGGELRETTTLFADLNGFTPLAERLQSDPHRLIRLINTLLDGMSNAVLANDGTIDKFMGDNVMAFWNAPLDEPRHAAKACAAALAMQQAVTEIDRKFQADPEWSDIFDGTIHLAAGIGINTGHCVVGNLGSTHRFDYSAIGDAVNLASRFEGAAKRYGVTALATAETVAQANEGGASFAFLPVGQIFVRGRAEGVFAYALVGGRERAESPEFAELLKHHTRALEAAEAGDWAVYAEALDHCRALAPDLAQLYRVFAHERLPRNEVSSAT